MLCHQQWQHAQMRHRALDVGRARRLDFGMLQMRDHYSDELAILGVKALDFGECRSLEDYNGALTAWKDGPLKKAYRAKAMKTHPDSNRENPDAEMLFKALGAAYESLCSIRIRHRQRPPPVQGFASSLMTHHGGVFVIHVVVSGAGTYTGSRSRGSWTL